MKKRSRIPGMRRDLPVALDPDMEQIAMEVAYAYGVTCYFAGADPSSLSTEALLAVRDWAIANVKRATEIYKEIEADPETFIALLKEGEPVWE